MKALRKSRVIVQVIVLSAVPGVVFLGSGLVLGHPSLGLTLFSGFSILLLAMLWGKTVLVESHQEAMALARLGSLPFQSLPPWSEYALSPRVLEEILFQVQWEGAQTVVECGSGVSTLYLARVLATQRQGRVYSVEHDEAWAKYIERLLASNELSNVVTVIRAPLRKQKPLDTGGLWYDEEAIRRFMPANLVVDMLIVDGPPERFGPRCRFPALPFFSSYLRRGALIVLDDVHRRGESAVLKAWMREFSGNVKLLKVVGEASFLRWV